MGGKSVQRGLAALSVFGFVSMAGVLSVGYSANAAPPVITDQPTQFYTGVNMPIAFTGGADPITGDLRAITIASAEGSHATCNPGSDHNDGIYTGACVSVQLQVDGGGASLSLTSGAVEFHVGDGTDDVQINISGTLPDITDALGTLVYTPPNDFETTDSNPETLHVSVQDAKPSPESIAFDIDIRVEGDNAFPDLTAPTDDPYDVEVNQEFTILESAGTEDFTVTDEDVEQGEADDYLLGVAWVDCGEITFPVGDGFIGEPDVLLSGAGFDPSLVPGMVPAALAFSTGSNDPAPAIAWLAEGSDDGNDVFNDAMRWIVFHAPAAAGTCTLTMVVTDLGNNGMPFPEEVPMPGVDFDSVVFNVTDPTVDTTEPVETTEPPVETTEPPVETTEPPVETTEPPVETTEPPVETTEPPVETTQPAGPTSSTPSPETTGAAPATPPPAAGLTAAVVVPRLQRGQTQTGTGHGFQPGEVVTGEQHSATLALGTQVADANGDVTFTWAIRAGETLGVHAFIVTGPQSGSASANFEVFAPAGGGAGSALPRTGTSIAVLLSVAGLLLLAGTALVHRSRRV